MADIAIIGLSCRFPGANNADEFWSNILHGTESIQTVNPDRLQAYGVNKLLSSHPNYINACAFLNDIDKFDNDLFKISDLEAAAMDPQHRLFLQEAYHALEDSGYSPEKYDGRIGIYAGSGPTQYYHELIKNNFFERHPQSRQLLYYLGNEKDFLALRVAYALNLTGPAININLASATGLAVVVKACQSLINGEADIMLAGASSVILPTQFGYIHEPGNIFSADGHCRPFDKNSSGTVLGSGVGILVLKRLDQAIKDKDSIYAVLKGYAINNDGNQKIGFTAPSIQGQADCVKEALRIANVNPKQIHFIEAHGTGTHLGDPIEITALTKGLNVTDPNTCAIGSVKANIGHAQSAAGMAGLIKMILSIKNKTVPPAINFSEPNPRINFNNSPFYVNTTPINWVDDTRIGGVNALAMGGVNAHVIVANFDSEKNSKAKFKYDYNIIPLSANCEKSLEIMQKNLISYLSNLSENMLHDSGTLNSIAYTLQVGRNDFPIKRAYICNNPYSLLESLRNELPNKSTPLDHILNDWLSDEPIKWKYLYSDIPQISHLPKYPFLENSHWLLESDKDLLSGKAVKQEKQTTPKNYSFEEIIEKLSGIWVKSLNLKTFDPHDDFSSLGGDSLLSLEIITEIEKELGFTLSIDQFMKESSVVNLSKLISNHSESSQTKAALHILNDYSPHNINLFIVHPGNGEIYFYKELAKKLNTKINLVGINNNVFNDIVQDEAISIKELAAIYVSLIKELQPTGRYSLAGWSFGGVVAFEMAQQLENNKDGVERLFLIDSWAKYSKKLNDENYFFNTYLSSNDDALPLSKTGLWGELLWKRMQALFEYQPVQLNTLVTLLKASSINTEYQEINACDNHWQQYCKQPIATVLIEGNHETMLESSGLERIANSISSTVFSSHDLLEK